MKFGAKSIKTTALLGSLAGVLLVSLFSFVLEYKAREESISSLIVHNEDFIKSNAIKHFDNNFKSPVEEILSFLTLSSSLKAFISSASSEVFLHKVNVEQEMIRLLKTRDKVVSSIVFFDDELVSRIGVAGRKRMRESFRLIDYSSALARQFEQSSHDSKNKQHSFVSNVEGSDKPYYVDMGQTITDPETGEVSGLLVLRVSLTELVAGLTNLKSKYLEIDQFSISGEVVKLSAADSIGSVSDEKASQFHSVSAFDVDALFSFNLRKKQEVIAEEFRSSLSRHLLLALAVVLFVSMLLNRFMVAILKPLQLISDSTKQIMSGNFDAEVPMSGYEEVDVLATDFNSMRTDLNRSVADLEAQKRLFESTVNQTVDSVVLFDPLGLIKYVNKSGRALFGEQAEGFQLEALQGCQIFMEDGKTPFPSDWHLGRRALVGTVTGENMVIKNSKWPDGVFVSVSASPMKDEVGATIGAVMVIRDVTKARNAEFELREAQKLAAIGEMAGGIAHEINNPLAIIKGCADLTLFQLKDGSVDLEEIRLMMGDIRSTVDRMTKITNGLKKMSRREHTDEFERVSVNKVIEETLSFSRDTIENKGVELKIEAIADIEIDCRPTQVSQVVLNFLNNAVDAVESLPEKWIKVFVEDLEKQVAFNVVDSGSGIPEELVEKVSKPFFTTKSASKGTGLGMSIANSIANSHGGHLVLTKLEGHTCIKLVLPKVQSPKKKQKDTKKEAA